MLRVQAGLLMTLTMFTPAERLTNNAWFMLWNRLSPVFVPGRNDLPLQWDAETLRKGMNLTLMTSVGPLDIFGEIIGGPYFEHLVADTIILKLFGTKCRCLNLQRLIKVKEATGRPKDLQLAEELKVLLEEQNRQ